MRKPLRRLVRSTFRGNFNDRSDNSGRLLDFTIQYNNLTGSGRLMEIRFGFVLEPKFDSRIKRAIAACGMDYRGQSMYGNVNAFCADIPAKSGVNGDLRVKELIHELLCELGMHGFSPDFRMEITREYEIRVPRLDGPMCWFSEGRFAQESIANLFYKSPKPDPKTCDHQ